MAATGDPPEDVIAFLCETTGLSRQEAITRLKANNNNGERALDEFFTDPDSTKYKYDESQFGLDREGEGGNSGISFNIQGPDQVPVGSYFDHGSAAPTRPPSRVNNRSPMGAPSNLAQEDADLQRALAESAAESGVAPQEAGVIDNNTNATYFGPARAPDYAAEQWAMVPTGPTVTPVDTELPPSARKRQPGVPGFLRESPHVDCRLGALVSIYHRIPLARNTFLNCGQEAPTYGHNTEWWKGKPILKPENLVRLQMGEHLDEIEGRPVFHEEIHRLMAFLDNSERSFARVDSLFETPQFQAYSWSDIESRLLMIMTDLSGDKESNPNLEMDPMMVKGKMVPVQPPEEMQDGDYEEEDPIDFALLDIRIDYEQYSWVKTLYDALDQLMWANALSPDHTFPERASMALLIKPAEVLTMRLSGPGLQAPIEIPEVFYADRYMEGRQETALHLQRQVHEIKRNGLQKLARWVAERTKCQGESGCKKYKWLEQPHDIRQCHEKAIKHAQYLLERLRKDVQWRHFQQQGRDEGKTFSIEDIKLVNTWTGPLEFTVKENETRSHLEAMVHTLQDRVDTVNKSLSVCEERKAKYHELLKIIGKRLTCEEKDLVDDEYVFSTDPEAYKHDYWNPQLKYLLRGVALTPELYYVCVREADDLIQIDDSETSAEDQWWKIHAPVNQVLPAKVEKATVEDVLHAAGTESTVPLLIYATEAAMQTSPVPLSDALRRFVKADNRSFQSELSREETQEKPPAQPPRPQVQGPTAENIAGAYGPAKRKHTGSSSVATNGSSRDELDDVDLTFTDINNDGFEVETPSGSASRIEYLGSSQVDTFNRSSEPEQIDWTLAGEPDAKSEADVEEAGANLGEAKEQKPEMQERGSGGGLAFAMQHSGRSPKQAAPNSMDMDLDPPYRGG